MSVSASVPKGRRQLSAWDPCWRGGLPAWGGFFFFSFPGLGGSRGARRRRGVVGTARSLRSAKRRGEGRAEGRREPVAFPEHLGAGSASRRRAGTCLLDEPALEAPEVPRSSRTLPALPGFRLRAPGPVGAPMMRGAGSYNVCDGISVDARWGVCVSVRQCVTRTVSWDCQLLRDALGHSTPT